MDLSTIPLLPNPSGAPPDFLHGPSLHREMLRSGIAFIAISGLFVTLRLATNIKIARKLGLDDVLCTLALTGGAAYWALNIYISSKGATRHAWDISLSSMSPSMAKAQVAILLIMAPTLWAAKAAILALYVRVFGSVSWIRRISQFWIVFMALFYSINLVTTGVYCVPRKGEVWGGISSIRCAQSTRPYIVVGVFSCIADLLIFILPFPIVMKLHIDRTRKITLSAIFGTGIILVGLSVVSLYLRIKVTRGNDATWTIATLSIVTYAEIFGTVMVSCAPGMSSFWHKIVSDSELWTSIKSSKFFTSLRFRSSRSSSVQHKPSFVFSNPIAQPSKTSHRMIEQNDSTCILYEKTYNSSEEVNKTGPSYNDFITQPQQVAIGTYKN